ncbi:MAG TPA: TRC40/GET3/ArsA family transport-energizing ATPase [Thermoanaerobaculia bacterium]|nr:TRC40/GET3/ArsA family transport-energizing ATPase [Thermoanaerobaculia bacterium]
MSAFTGALDELRDRRVILFGGKGGVGKTTLARAAASHLGATLVRVETLDTDALYRRFLDENLESFLEIGDRGTYLDREELRRLFELALPGVDELMTWMHIGELAESSSLIVVDTAPTGHTLRMLSSSEHFHQLALALDSMAEKHRAMVQQFTRRIVRDAVDAFIEEFDARASRRRELLAAGAFVPVMLSEPLVVMQTVRLIEEVGMPVPFVVLNRAVLDPDCALDEVRVERDRAARAQFARVVDYPRDCGNVGRASARLPRGRRAEARPTFSTVTFFAGKGGVGKTTTASSLALQLATRNPTQSYVIISVDPAHSLRDVFATEPPPPNLRVETIDTKAKWRRFRDSLGREIEGAFDALAPKGMSIAHDSEAMQQLIEIAPPGADELFAITRLADLIADESLAAVLVDTAPTGHFLRLLDLPKTAGTWVREFMRLLLRYKELIPPGELGEELVRASRALKELEATLHSEQTTVIVVTRPEEEVVAETRSLVEELEKRGIPLGGVIANYVTPENECRCDQSMRAHELAVLAGLGDVTLIERRDAPPVTLAELATMIPT